MVTDALIYDQTVLHYLKFVATTVGRDKILRTFQYFSRFLAWYLYHTDRPQSFISPFEATKKQFGALRKLLCVGEFVEHFRAAAVASDAKSLDPVLRFTTVGRQLGYAFYMLLDDACVLDAANIRKFSSATRLLRESYRAWFTGLSFSIASGFYSYYELSLCSRAIASSSSPEKVFGREKVENELNTVTMQLLSDLCDMTIPSSALGWVDLDDGIVGLAGTISSLLGVWSQWKNTA